MSTTNGATAHFTYQIRIYSAKDGLGRNMKRSFAAEALILQCAQVHAWLDKLLHEAGCRRYGNLGRIGTSAIVLFFLESSFINHSMQRRPALARRPPQSP